MCLFLYKYVCVIQHRLVCQWECDGGLWPVRRLPVCRCCWAVCSAAWWIRLQPSADCWPDSRKPAGPASIQLPPRQRWSTGTELQTCSACRPEGHRDTLWLLFEMILESTVRQNLNASMNTEVTAAPHWSSLFLEQVYCVVAVGSCRTDKHQSNMYLQWQFKLLFRH